MHGVRRLKLPHHCAGIEGGRIMPQWKLFQRSNKITDYAHRSRHHPCVPVDEVIIGVRSEIRRLVWVSAEIENLRNAKILVRL